MGKSPGCNVTDKLRVVLLSLSPPWVIRNIRLRELLGLRSRHMSCPILCIPHFGSLQPAGLENYISLKSQSLANYKNVYFDAVSIIVNWRRALKVSHDVYDPYSLEKRYNSKQKTSLYLHSEVSKCLAVRDFAKFENAEFILITLILRTLRQIPLFVTISTVRPSNPENLRSNAERSTVKVF